VRLDPQRVVREDADLAQRALLQRAVGGPAHRILPGAERTLRHQLPADRRRIGAAQSHKVGRGKADDDLVAAGDDLEQLNGHDKNSPVKAGFLARNT
jgi:hypothetical protein